MFESFVRLLLWHCGMLLLPTSVLVMGNASCSYGMETKRACYYSLPSSRRLEEYTWGSEVFYEERMVLP